MGADLYLVSVMNDAHATYRPAYRLAVQAYRLAQQDPATRLYLLSGNLFDAVQDWFSSSGAFDADLYDLVIQVRDLCQGETSVWLQELAAELLREVRQRQANPAGADPSLLSLVQQVDDLAHSRPEGALLALLDEIEQRVSASLSQQQRACDSDPAPCAVEGALAPAGALPEREAHALAAHTTDEEPPLLVVVRKLRHLARGLALDALTDLVAFMVEHEKLHRAVSLRFDAQLGVLVDHLQLRARGVTSDAASLPLMAANLQRATSQWRQFVESCFDDLRARLEEMQAQAQAGTPDMSPADGRELLGRLDELAAGVMAAIEGWHEQAHERGTALAEILSEAGVEPPQPLSLVEIDEALLLGAGEASPSGSVVGPDLAEAALPDLMKHCLRTSLQRFMVAAGSLVFFAKAAERVRQLAGGQMEGLLRIMATTFVERVRPSEETDAADMEEPDPVADGDVMDRFWFQFQRGAKEAVSQAFRQQQEEEADPAEHPLFVLAIQLRDLVCGDPSGRMRALAARLEAALALSPEDEPAGPVGQEGETTDHLVELARAVCGLLRDDPRARLRALAPHLLGALERTGAAAPLAIARQMQNLLQGRMTGQVQDLLQELVACLEGVTTVPEEITGPLRALAQEVRTLLEGDPAEQMWGILRGVLLHIVTRLEKLSGTTPDAPDAPRWALCARLHALLEVREGAEVDWGQVQETWQQLVEALARHLDERRPYTSLLEQASACGLCLASDAGLEREELLSIIVQGLLRRAVDTLEDLQWPKAGHFRDNYNETSALWTARWFWMTDVIPLLDREGLDELPEIHWWPHSEQGVCGLLGIPAVRRLYQRLQETEPVFPTREKLLRWRLRVDEGEEGEYSLAGWHAHLRERREQLLAFLDGALRREEPILCSI